MHPSQAPPCCSPLQTAPQPSRVTSTHLTTIQSWIHPQSAINVHPLRPTIQLDPMEGTHFLLICNTNCCKCVQLSMSHSTICKQSVTMHYSSERKVLNLNMLLLFVAFLKSCNISMQWDLVQVQVKDHTRCSAQQLHTAPCVI